MMFSNGLQVKMYFHGKKLEESDAARILLYQS